MQRNREFPFEEYRNQLPELRNFAGQQRSGVRTPLANPVPNSSAEHGRDEAPCQLPVFSGRSQTVRISKESAWRDKLLNHKQAMSSAAVGPYLRLKWL